MTKSQHRWKILHKLSLVGLIEIDPWKYLLLFSRVDHKKLVRNKMTEDKSQSYI